MTTAIRYDDEMDRRVHGQRPASRPLPTVTITAMEFAILLSVTTTTAEQHDECGAILDVCSDLCHRLGIPQQATARPSMIVEALAS